jgi:peptide deformylase
MIKRGVTQIGNPIIRKKSKRVGKVSSKSIQKTVGDLVDSMRFHELVGMAAPQIGLNLRIFVTEIRKTKTRKPKEKDQLRVYIKPRIVSFSQDKSVGYEGCGSVASGQLFGPVKRPQRISVKAQDERGKQFTLQAKGLLARVVQHELDHLNGIVYLDRVTDITKLMNQYEYIKRFR